MTKVVLFIATAALPAAGENDHDVVHEQHAVSKWIDRIEVQKEGMTTLLLLLTTLAADPLGPGDHTRKLTVDGRERSYLVHIPPKYDHEKPTPVVLIFHGAGTNAAITVSFTGMSKKSDEAGFIAVYPNGTGLGPFLTLNAGGRQGKLAEGSADDVKYVGALPISLIGNSTLDISANDLMWEFFQKHPMR